MSEYSLCPGCEGGGYSLLPVEGDWLARIRRDDVGRFAGEGALICRMCGGLGVVTLEQLNIKYNEVRARAVEDFDSLDDREVQILQTVLQWQ